MLRVGESGCHGVAFFGRVAQGDLDRGQHLGGGVDLSVTRVRELALLQGRVARGSALPPREPDGLCGDILRAEHHLDVVVEIQKAQSLAVEIEDDAVHLYEPGSAVASSERAGERIDERSARRCRSVDDRQPRIQLHRHARRAELEQPHDSVMCSIGGSA